MKREAIQKLVMFGAMTFGALLIAEGYLRARAFVDRVNTADHQIALLRHEVEALRVQVDETPRGSGQPTTMLAAVPAPSPLVLPIPEPMRLPVAAPERPQKAGRVKDTPALAVAPEPAKSDPVPDDGKIVLMKDTKAAPASAQQVAGAATVDVKLWAKK
jgi:hypothetical protein